MKLGIRTPSLKGRISSRLSVKRMIRSKVRVPKGLGLVTNPKKLYTIGSITEHLLV